MDAMKNIITRSLVLLTALMTLNACGVKPAGVESPSAGKDEFPHTYPDPATDTKASNRPVQF